MSHNRLASEKSPYLLQHQHNPVHWQAWGEPAFAAARDERKPIFLSVGYSTCHWCHVMAHESFEDEQVAALLNEHFICIKLDREERPDVDEIYMAAVHALGQRGGWPLSMFLTSELKPFFGGTYWPKPHFINILKQIGALWRQDPNKIAESADSLLEQLREQKQLSLSGVDLSDKVFEKFFQASAASYDHAWGGFGGAPKFPHAMQLSMLLRHYERGQNEQALQMVVHTLDKMARGGLYDHLGGGFARYSTDVRWLIPHFEKMLYDNALLAVTYLEAYQITQIAMFESVAKETLDYVLRVMTQKEGGFYSAEDADSEGHEGKFYVWSYAELEKYLSDKEFSALKRAYDITKAGNFEGSIHLSLKEEAAWEDKDELYLQAAQRKLFTIRETRIHPHKDDKILTAWNGLMLRAMALGFQVTGQERYLNAAQAAAGFIRKHLWHDGNLLARYRDGEARFNARLEDYAFLIQGLLDLYQSDFNAEHLHWAVELQGLQDEKFWDGASGGYYFSDGGDSSLLIRTKEIMDGALPNANAVAALNLLRIHGFTAEAQYRERAGAIFKIFSPWLKDYPHACSQLLIAYDFARRPGWELAVLGEVQAGPVKELLLALREGFYPQVVVAQSPSSQTFPPLLQNREALNGQPTFYLCREGSCELPLHDFQQVLEKIKTFSPSFTI